MNLNQVDLMIVNQTINSASKMVVSWRNQYLMRDYILMLILGTRQKGSWIARRGLLLWLKVAMCLSIMLAPSILSQFSRCWRTISCKRHYCFLWNYQAVVHEIRSNICVLVQ